MLSEFVTSPKKCNNKSKSFFYPFFQRLFSFCELLLRCIAAQNEHSALQFRGTGSLSKSYKYVRSHSNANQVVNSCNRSQNVDHHTKDVRFADSATHQTFLTHSRAWRIKRSKPNPETTPKTSTSLTLISSLRSEKSKKNRKTVRVQFFFL